MDELNKEYTLLFNGITDTIQQMEVITQRLKRLQVKAEEAYVLECERAEGDAPAPMPAADKDEK